MNIIARVTKTNPVRRSGDNVPLGDVFVRDCEPRVIYIRVPGGAIAINETRVDMLTVFATDVISIWTVTILAAKKCDIQINVELMRKES